MRRVLWGEYMNKGAYRRTVGSVVVIAALGLSGCVAPLSTPPASSSPTTPIASPTATPALLDCDALVTQSAIDALMTTSTPRSDALERALDGAIADGPFAVVNAGGTVCQWGDNDLTRVRVRVLPHASAEWDKLAAIYTHASTPGASYDGGTSRGGSCTMDRPPSCSTNVLVGSSWLAVDASSSVPGAITEPRFHEFVQHLIPAVADADISAPPPPQAKPLACSSDAYQTALAGAYGIPHATSMGVEETFRIEGAATWGERLTLCHYQPSNDGSGGYLGTLSVLPSASRSYAIYTRLVSSGSDPAEKIQLTQGSKKVEALRRSATADTPVRIYVDTLVDGNWIQFTAAAPYAQPDKAAAFAQWVVENLGAGTDR